MQHYLYEVFESKKIISIVRGVKKEQIIDTATSLLAGGINCIEVTFDHSSTDGINNTIACLDAISRHFGDKVILGAGTVLSEEEVAIAHYHNAKYIISPDTNLRVIKATKEKGMFSMPGALTPSEIVSAYENGADIVKLFPIDTLGLPYLKAVKSPLKHIPLSAVGGVTPDNVQTFLENGAMCVGIGSSLVSKALVDAGQFDKITLQAKAFSSAVSAWRN